MSEYDIQVGKAITVSIEYDEWTFDEDQAEELYEALGRALGKVPA